MKQETHDGLAAASRASLNRLRAFPAEESLRWCLFRIPEPLLVPLLVLNTEDELGPTPQSSEDDIGMGAALEAAMDSESKLCDGEKPSPDCSNEREIIRRLGSIPIQIWRTREVGVADANDEVAEKGTELIVEIDRKRQR